VLVLLAEEFENVVSRAGDGALSFNH
jgi:hypothetical protein